MSAAIQSCPMMPEDPCKRLAREIDEMINRDKRLSDNSGTHGLRHRFREQIEGANGPGTKEWESHDRVMREQQKGLRDRLDEFNKNNCGAREKIPEDAWHWATKPRPKPEEWKGPQTVTRSAAVPADSGFMKKMAALTGLTGTALLIYVIVSEGSRVFPPRNLIPVP